MKSFIQVSLLIQIGQLSVARENRHIYFEVTPKSFWIQWVKVFRIFLNSGCLGRLSIESGCLALKATNLTMYTSCPNPVD